MKTLITGATGFIGKNLVKELSKTRNRLYCLIRKTSRKGDIDFLKSLGISLVYGDITEKETLEDIIDKVDVIYHLAGVLGSFKIPENEYHEVHVKGTKNIVGLCKNQKLIFCSSAGILGPVFNGTEKSRINPTNAYEKAKADAENIVKGYSNHVVLRPEFVYGPHDLHVLSLFRTIKSRRFFIIGNGSSMLHPTYIGDLVYCLVKCLDKKIKNQVYMVAGEKPVSVLEFYELVADILDVKANKIMIPLPFARAYTPFAYLLNLLNINPIMTRSTLDFFTKSRTFSSGKAKSMLNYRPIKLKEGLEKTTLWYENNGFL